MSIRNQAFDLYVKQQGYGNNSLFVRAFGRIMHTQPNELLIITSFRCAEVGINIRINTSEYMQFPDGSQSPGVRDSGPVRIYILPEQNWDIVAPNISEVVGDVMVHVRYELYDGSDGVAAMTLINNREEVTPEAVRFVTRRNISLGGPIGEVGRSVDRAHDLVLRSLQENGIDEDFFEDRWRRR